LGYLRERGQWNDADLNRRIILNYYFKMWCGGGRSDIFAYA
jgi:hypothetical protein